MVLQVLLPVLLGLAGAVCVVGTDVETLVVCIGGREGRGEGEECAGLHLDYGGKEGKRQ